MPMEEAEEEADASQIEAGEQSESQGLPWYSGCIFKCDM
jgi:hypothetical protein